MKRHFLGLLPVVLTLFGCKGEGGPTSPSNTSSCATPVVISCPGPSFSGGAAFGQISIAAGGSATCNVGLNQAIPVSFTILNAGSATVWGARRSPNGSNGGPLLSAQPATGTATTGATIQTTLMWTGLPRENTNGTLSLVLGAAVVPEMNGLINNVSAQCDAPLFVHN